MLQKENKYEQLKKISNSYHLLQHTNYYDKVAYYWDTPNSTIYLSECCNSVSLESSMEVE
jgi:hypothetical protein